MPKVRNLDEIRIQIAKTYESTFNLSDFFLEKVLRGPRTVIQGINDVMENIVTKFQIDPRSDGARARTKVRFCNLYSYFV